MFYELRDTRGMPQCGCDVRRFGEWFELAEYVDEHEDVYERIHDGYAVVLENNDPHYVMETADGYEIVTRDELPELYAAAIGYGYGSESTFDNWLFDMQRAGIITEG